MKRVFIMDINISSKGNKYNRGGGNFGKKLVWQVGRYLVKQGLSAHYTRIQSNKGLRPISKSFFLSASISDESGSDSGWSRRG